jgi:hypothetical protein
MVDLGRDAELVVGRVAEDVDVETDESEKEEDEEIVEEIKDFVEDKIVADTLSPYTCMK